MPLAERTLLYDIVNTVQSMADISKADTPFGDFHFSNAFFDFMKNWTNSLNMGNKSLTDWRIWLPRAFYLNWSDPPTWQRTMADPTIWLPMIYYPQEERERILNIINIAGDYVAGNKVERLHRRKFKKATR